MPHLTPRVAVLVLAYNDRRNLRDCLRSASQQDYKNYAVFFIDNASQDGSVEYVRQNFPKVKIILHRKNLGYAGAYAKVLATIFQQDFDAAVLLNADVRVDKHWLKELTRSAYADPRIGFAQPKIFLWGNSKLANTFGNEIHYLGFGFCGHYRMKDSKAYAQDRDIAYASGASLFIKKEAYVDIGGMDRDFFSYLEDQDLVWRGHVFGWRAVMSAKSIMWHKYVFRNPARSRWKFHMYERNRLLFIMKNYSTKLIVLVSPMLVIMEVGMLFDALIKGYTLDKLRAYRDVIVSLPTYLPKRRWIQSHRTVSDRELFPLFAAQIRFPELKSPLLDASNAIFQVYYQLIKTVL